MRVFRPWMMLGLSMVLSAAAAQTAITKTSLNLREAPSASAPVRQVLEAGRTVYIWNEILDEDYDPDWSQVLIGTQVGWVKSDYLSYEKAVRVGSFDDAYFGQAARIKEAFKLKFNPDPEVALDTEWLVRVQKVNPDYFVRRNDRDLLPYVGDALAFRQKPTVETHGDSQQLVFSFPALNAGGYVVSLARASSPNAVVSAIPLYISNLSVVTKNTPDQVHFWAVDVKTGQPVPDADVQMFTLKEGQRVNLGAGKTSKQGILSLKASRDQKINYIVSDGTSEAYTPPENSTPVGETYRTLVLTDRPLYQQTDTVQITGVTRQHVGGGYRPYTGPATLRIIDPQSNTIFSKSLKLDALGAFREDLPMNFSRTGTYRAEVVISTSTPTRDKPTEDVSFVPFMVQPYIKPSFDLTLSVPEEVLAGETTLKLQSTLYGGGKTSAKVDVFAGQGYVSDFFWGQYNSRGGLTEEDYQDTPVYELYGGAYDPMDTESRVAQTTLQNGEGSVKLQLQARDNLPTEYDLTVRAFDEFGRKVVTQKRVMVYPGNLVITATTPDVVKSRTAVSFPLQARKVGGSQGASNQTLNVKIVRSTWEWDTPAQEWKEKVLQTFTTQVKTDASGKATVSYTPSGSGSLRLEVTAKDEKGRPASLTQHLGYIPEEAPQVRPTEAFEITTPGQRFKVGDTVPVTLTSNLPKGTIVWLTAERSGVYQQQQVKITGKDTKASIKVTPEMQPGFWVNAVYHSAEKPVTVAFHSFVHVPVQGKNLQVKLIPEKSTLKPGESSRMRVETTLNGQPVSAWVSVGAVNEAVYALVEDAIPDPWRYFWGVPFGVDVNTTTSLPAGFPPETGGGGGGMTGNFLRSRFKDTAFFQSVTTDKKGVALVNFTLPEDLTRYRVLARGVTADTATGETQGALRAALGFYVRLSAPTLLTRGDETTVYTTVHNETRDRLQVTVQFKLPSGTLKKNVTVEANSSAVVPWIVKAPDADSVTLETSASSGSLADGVSTLIPIRNAGTDFELVRTGEANGNAMERLNVPPTAEQAQIGVFVSASPLLGALSDLDDLIYEDQKNPLDAALAAFHAAQARKALGLDPTRAQALLRLNLQHLLAQQQLDGFAWADGRPSGPYTLLALTVIGQTLSSGMEYSSYHFRRALDDLAAAKVDSSSFGYQKMLYFMGQDNNLKTFAPRNASQAAELAALFQDQNHYRTALKDQVRDSQGLSIDGDLEATSHALLAAVALKKDEAKDFARWLAARLQGSTPSNPSGRALAAHALAQFIKDAGVSQLSEPVSVTVNGRTQTVNRIPVLGTTLYFEGKPGQNTVQLGSQQPYFYTLKTRYLTATTEVNSEAFTLERSYSTTTLKDHSTTEVRLKLKLLKPVQHLRLTDPIPAGFETLDLSAYQDVQPSSSSTLWSSKEHLDGATVIYLENLKAGDYTISYKLRSLAPGTYISPAPSLMDLDTGLKSSGKSTTLTVKP